jgi:hypothetical protein
MRYYDDTPFEAFETDLLEKNQVILLLDEQNRIQGFSTILQSKLKINGIESIALFSGDTVLEREFWGNGALATAFGHYLTWVKIRNPFTEVYWFLISKGYKTYLLMANNFPNHFPRHNLATPTYYLELMRSFYGNRFGEAYEPLTGLIRPQSKNSSHLKNTVAEITEEGLLNPKIAYFAQCNPNWKSGVELACIAKVNLWIPIRYFLKRMRKAAGRDQQRVSTVYRQQ